MADFNEFRIQVRADYPEPGWWDIQLVACPIRGLPGPKGKIQPKFTRRQLRRLRSRHGWPNRGELEQIGSTVWKSLMTPDLAAAFRNCLQRSHEQGKGLQITVVTLGSEQRDEGSLTVDDPVRLAELPVEALYDEQQGFLATDLNSPICRGLQTEPDRVPAQTKLPLRVLVAVATPTDKPPARAEEEVRAICCALDPLTGPGNPLELDIYEQPTRSGLVGRLQSCHIFHFIGHGGFDVVGSDPTSQAYITLVEENGTESDPLNAYDLSNILRNTEVQLVVFTACASAAAMPDEEPYPTGAFDGMAQRLVSGISGVTGTVAMQFDMEADAAVTFSQAFYQHLLEPDRTLVEAVTLARKRVSVRMGLGHRAWVTPTVYCRGQGGRVFGLAVPDKTAKATVELNSSQRRKLRRVMLDCRYMKAPQLRRQIMSDMQKDYPEITFRSSQDPQIEVADIVDSCFDYGGLHCLEDFLRILEGYEGAEADTMKAVWAAWKEIVI
jgi:hypothetical protein